MTTFCSRAEVALPSGIPHPLPAGATRNLIETARRASREARWLAYAVEADRQLAGVATLDEIRWQERSAKVGLWLGLPYHGQGIGTLALAQLCGLAFQYMGLQKLEGITLADNQASIGILRKTRFQAEGTWQEQSADSPFYGRTMATYRLLAGLNVS